MREQMEGIYTGGDINNIAPLVMQLGEKQFGEKKDNVIVVAQTGHGMAFSTLLETCKMHDCIVVDSKSDL